MVRILYLHDERADFETVRGVGQLARGLGKGYEVTVQRIGAGGDYAGVARAAWRLRRGVQAYDIIHAWGAGAMVAAVLARVGRVVFSPTGFLSRGRIEWLRSAMQFRDVHVICPTATVRRRLVERGVAVERCERVRPGVDFGRVRSKRDAGLRAALGFMDDQTVLVGVGESTRAADHRGLVWAGTILNVLDGKTRVLLWGRGPEARAAKRFGAKLAQPELVTLAEERLGRGVELEELLSVADVGVVSAAGAVATLPVAVAMASGVPMVGTVTAEVSELLEDRHTALMTAAGAPRLLAQRIRALREDAGLGRRLADRARGEAYDYFSMSGFVEGVARVYGRAMAGVGPLA
jgi:glycosyltransferase involved in cell wall biosynthesis